METRRQASLNLYIRGYSPADWPAICQVHDCSRPDELAGSFDPRAFIPLAKDPEGTYVSVCEMFIAQCGDEVVGFAGVDDPYLAWLYVDPAYYRRGIGLALLRHCRECLSEDAWTIACGNNSAAIALYQSEGFVIESRYVGESAGFPGPLARLALHPERQGWTRRKKSQLASGKQAG